MGEEELDSLHLADEAASNLSSSPNATSSSLFSSSFVGANGPPAAAQTRMISPRDSKGRINNTPATSVFSDIFAERGHPSAHLKQHPLPGPVDTSSAPVKKVLSLPSAGVETETILGVVSAQLTAVSAPSEDSLWSQKKEKEGSEAGALIDIHLLTLATAPEERGQGLGAKLLAALHAECMSKARLMAMRLRNKPKSIPAITPLSPKFVDEPTLASTSSLRGAAVEASTRSPYLRALLPQPSLSELKPASPSTGRYLARTYLEVHPSNIHALALYKAHGFGAPSDDAKAIKRGFYRGDSRISTAERTKRGGTDGWVLERYDGLLSA